MEHECIKKDTLDRLEKNDEKFTDLLYGKNPPPGILQTLDKLSNSVDILNDGMPKLKDQINELLEFKTTETACKNSRMKNLEMAGVYLAILVSLIFGILNYGTSKSNAANSENTIITDPATLEQAIREGKNIKMRGATVAKEYEKNYQQGIKEMNK